MRWNLKKGVGKSLLERILDRDNLNRAYKRVKANKGDTSTNRQHEEHDGEMGWMAAATFPNVHLEAVEEAQNTHREPKETRYAGLAGISEWQHT